MLNPGVAKTFNDFSSKIPYINEKLERANRDFFLWDCYKVNRLTLHTRHKCTVERGQEQEWVEKLPTK